MKNKNALFALILLAVCLVNYRGSLNNDFLVDDHNFLSGKYNAVYKTLPDYFSTSKSQHFYPVYYLLNVSLFKYLPHEPYLFHVVNIVLFSCACLLLFRLLNMLTRDTPLSFLTSLFFAVHPIHAVYVDLIAFNFIFLFAIFMECSLMAYLSYCEDKAGRRHSYAASLFFFAAALLTFEGAILYPVYLALCLYFFKNIRLNGVMRSCLPYALLSILYFFFWLNVSGANAGLASKFQSLNLDVVSWLSTLLVLASWYIANLFYPKSIAWMFHASLDPSPAWWAGLTLILLAAIVITVITVRRKDLYSFALLWFLTGFLLVIPASFAHAYIGMVIEPYWLFFSSIGFFLSLAHFLSRTGRRVRKPALYFSLCCFFLYFFTFTQRYHIAWKNEKTFCYHWLRISPGNSIALFRLGVIYAEEGNERLARAFFHRTLLTGDYQKDKVYGNLALLDIARGQLESARDNAEKALTINPRYAAVYNTLGIILFKQSQIDESEKMLNAALMIDPSLMEALENLGLIYILKHQDQKAINLYENVSLDHLPQADRQLILSSLSALYLRNGRQKECFNTVEEYLKIDDSPKSYYNLALTFSSLGLRGMAALILNQCIRTHSRYKEAYIFMGEILARQGRLNDAIEIWQKGQAVAPQDKRFSVNILRAQSLLNTQK